MYPVAPVTAILMCSSLSAVLRDCNAVRIEHWQNLVHQVSKNLLPGIAKDGEPILTLITYGGDSNRSLTSYGDNNNVVVYAVPIRRSSRSIMIGRAGDTVIQLVAPFRGIHETL